MVTSISYITIVSTDSDVTILAEHRNMLIFIILVALAYCLGKSAMLIADYNLLTRMDIFHDLCSVATNPSSRSYSWLLAYNYFRYNIE